MCNDSDDESLPNAVEIFVNASYEVEDYEIFGWIKVMRMISHF